jgi:hypothetical protein
MTSIGWLSNSKCCSGSAVRSTIHVHRAYRPPWPSLERPGHRMGGEPLSAEQSVLSSAALAPFSVQPPAVLRWVQPLAPGPVCS